MFYITLLLLAVFTVRCSPALQKRTPGSEAQGVGGLNPYGINRLPQNTGAAPPGTGINQGSSPTQAPLKRQSLTQPVTTRSSQTDNRAAKNPGALPSHESHSQSLKSASQTRSTAPERQVLNSDDTQSSERSGGSRPYPVEAPRVYREEHEDMGGIFRWGRQVTEQKYYDPRDGSYYDHTEYKSWDGPLGIFGKRSTVDRKGPDRSRGVADVDIANPGENVERIQQARNTCQVYENSRVANGRSLNSQGTTEARARVSEMHDTTRTQSVSAVYTLRGGINHQKIDGKVFHYSKKSESWEPGQRFQNEQNQWVYWGYNSKGQTVEYVAEGNSWKATGRTCCDAKGNWIQSSSEQK